MPKSILQQRLTAYRQWKTRVTRAVLDLQSWLDSEGQTTSESRERIQCTLQALEKDHLTVAAVAEFSRGKTELINAIFFSDHGRRLLPSTPGRTTMCPTELLWDEERNEAYLRLLPIETRAQDAPIAKLKDDPKQWVHYPLRIQDPAQMTSTLNEIVQTKKVSMKEATRLGLSSGEVARHGQGAEKPVEIPKWRHAIVSFPHPLLKQGLVILDTPGLNALGSEPELTLSMIPTAQAVLFVLAADTGATRSDLEMWQHHLMGFQTGRKQGILVALNKIDVLWDELNETQETDTAIAKQRSETAETLGISDEVVFPISAQKALVAKIRGDNALLDKSGLSALESHLSEKMVEAKHQLLIDALDADVGQLLEHNRTRISTRIDDITAELEELKQLRGKSNEITGQLLEKTRQKREQYIKGVQEFQAGREELILETQLSRQILNRTAVEALMAKAYREMVRSWTTRGLAIAMKGLFNELRQTMQTLTQESNRVREKIRLTYQRFEEEFGFDIELPKVFDTAKFQADLELLHQEAEAFRRSPAMALREQGIVIKRFQHQLIGRAMKLFEQLQATFDLWMREALQPLAGQIHEHKRMMESRLENLQRIGRSKENLQNRIDTLQKQYVELAQQLTVLRNIHNALHHDPLANEQVRAKPRLVVHKAQ